MKRYRITLKSGLSTTMKVKNKKEIIRKINSCNFGILPIRGSEQSPITPDTVEKIELVKNKKPKKDIFPL